jgi:hypothetical protein
VQTQRAQNADRHVDLRLACLLGRGGHRVEADESEEDDGRSAENAARAEIAEFAGILRNERMPVGRMHKEGADDDERQHHGQFDRHHDVIEPRRLLGAEHEQGGQHGDNEDRRQIDDAGHRAAIGERHRGAGRSRHGGRNVIPTLCRRLTI